MLAIERRATRLTFGTIKENMRSLDLLVELRVTGSALQADSMATSGVHL